MLLYNKSFKNIKTKSLKWNWYHFNRYILDVILDLCTVSPDQGWRTRRMRWCPLPVREVSPATPRVRVTFRRLELLPMELDHRQELDLQGPPQQWMQNLLSQFLRTIPAQNRLHLQVAERRSQLMTNILLMVCLLRLQFRKKRTMDRHHHQVMKQ